MFKKALRKKYTSDDLNIIIKCVEKYPDNIQNGLEEAAKLLNTSFKAISMQYYTKIKKTTTVVAVASQGIIVRNKNTIRNNPDNINKLLLREHMLKAGLNQLPKSNLIEIIVANTTNEKQFELLNTLLS